MTRQSRLSYRAFCVGLCLLASCGATTAAQYAIFDAPGSSCTYGQAVNPSETIAGYYFNGANHGFVRTPDGTLSTFDPDGSTNTGPMAIDSDGTVTGFFDVGESGTHGFLRAPDGGITVFDPPKSLSTIPSGISNGIVAGTASLSDSNYANSGFVRAADGTFTLFNVPDLYATFAYAVNANGETTGIGWDGDGYILAFVRSADGTLTTFGNYANPTSINDSGAIVGNTYNVEKNEQHGFLRAPDGTITKIDPPRCSDPFALSIDAKGDIMGTCTAGSATRGFLRSAAGKYKLFDAPGSTYTRPYAIARIKRGSAITGSYSDSNNACHGFLRTN